MPAPKSEPV